MGDKIEDWLRDNESLGWNPDDDEFDTGEGDYNQHFELLSAPPALIASIRDERASAGTGPPADDSDDPGAPW